MTASRTMVPWSAAMSGILASIKRPAKTNAGKTRSLEIALKLVLVSEIESSMQMLDAGNGLN